MPLPGFSPVAAPPAPPWRDWLRARDWASVLGHLQQHPPTSAEAFEARALATMALQPGPAGARQALPDLRQAVALRPGHGLTLANLAQALIDAGQPAEALALAAEALHGAPTFYPLLEKQAFALDALAQWAPAADAVARALTALAAGGFAASPGLLGLQQELATRWWEPAPVAGLRLRPAGPADAGWLQRCLSDAAFTRRFHRFQGEAAHAAWIERATQRPSRTRRCEWLICRAEAPQQPLGLAGLVDIDLGHRRAELLVGLPGTPDDASAAGAGPASAGTALAASFAAMRFGFERLGLHKLVSYVYADNPQAQANTRHLGFTEEGFLRDQVFTPEGPVGLHVNGLLRTEFETHPLLRRLARRWD